LKNSCEEKTTVLSVERALNVIDILVEGKGRPKGVTEISKELGLVKGTVCKLISTLEKKGYVQRDSESDKYRLGLKFMEIGSIVKNSLELRSLAEPFLKDLEEITKRTVHMALLVDSEIVYIDKVESRQSIRMASYVGQRSFIHSTSLGKAICAYLPEEEVGKFLKAKGMPKFTANTITTVEGFLEHLDIVRARGYAVDENENEESIRCVAAPIFDYSGRPVAAISVSGTVTQVSKDILEQIAAKVVQEATNISRKMGYSGFYNEIR
jgi:DNA-binding IclR family transcriptional regulator